MLTRAIRHRLSKISSWVNIKYFRLMGTQIGDGCFISRGARIDVRRGKIIIGNNVHISSGTFILGHVGFRPLKEGQKTEIEDNVKIFVNSVILPGVKIGENSVVGAGAVVMKDVPPNVLVMGNPARVVQKFEDTD